MISIEPVGRFDTSEKQGDFVTTNAKEKSEIIDSLVRASRKAHLDYDDLLYIFQRTRKKLKLRRPKKGRALPKLLSDADLKSFFRAIQDCGNCEHAIMLRLLFYTAIRVSELVNIRVSDVDTGASKIFIENGKGAKDRYVLYPEAFGLVLSTHMQNNPRNKYLFESQRFGPFSTRRIQQIVEGYGKAANIERVHPHLFRHQLLTYATRNGLTDAQIQLISGHSSKKSLEVYQHCGLQDVEQAYQQAVKGMVV